MRIRAFTEKYIRTRDISDGYIHNLRKRVEKLAAFAGTRDVSKLFNEKTLSQFLAQLPAGSPHTYNKYRCDLLTLWRAAADDDLCEYPNARRIRRLKLPPSSVECFTLDEVRQLAAAAEKLKGGYHSGIGRRYYWMAMIRFAWDSGLRRGDCWRFEVAMLRRDRTFRIIQHKTRKPIRRLLQPETVEAIKRINRPKPFEWEFCIRAFAQHFHEVRELADVERGTFKWLRRAAGSHVEAEHPGAGHKVLGNTEQVFRTHYDADMGQTVYAPPAL